MRNILKGLLMLFIIVVFAPTVKAHMLWLNAESYVPEVGKPVYIEIGWGHKFPKDEVIKEGILKRIYAFDQKGKEIPLKQRGPAEFEFMPEKNGIFLILASIHPGFLTKTDEGYKLKSKAGLKNAISCFNFDMRAKVVLNIGKFETGFDRLVGEPLEIVPLKDPSQLKKGESLPLKVLFKGKPLPNSRLNATFGEVSKDLWIITDNEGIGQIKLSEKGRWLITVVHEIPYPDPEVCDKYRYTYSLTLEVK